MGGLATGIVYSQSRSMGCMISHAVVSAYRIEGTSYPPSKRPKLKLQKIIS